MTTHKAVLLVNAQGNMRLVKRQPVLGLGEVAFCLTVNIPDSWSRIVGNVKLDLPEAPEPEVLVEFAQ